MIPIACIAVVRVGSRPAAPPPPPAGQPAPAPVSTDGIFSCFFDGFVGAPLGSAKALSLQVLFPKDACLYRNEAVAGAGAYDDIIKAWIRGNEAALVGKLLPAPFTDPAPLLRLIAATVAAGASTTPGSGAGASAAIPAANECTSGHLAPVGYSDLARGSCGAIRPSGSPAHASGTARSRVISRSTAAAVARGSRRRC